MIRLLRVRRQRESGGEDELNCSAFHRSFSGED
jgi:hypothetical protein